MKCCKRYSSWKAIDWSKVMFSDETTIKQFKSFKTLVRRPPGKRNDMKYAISTVSHSPSVMIWGAITAKSACNLWLLPKNTTINGETYLRY